MSIVLKTLNIPYTSRQADERAIMAELHLTLSEAAILRSLWKCDSSIIHIKPRALRQHIYNLRRKLTSHNIVIVNLQSGQYDMPPQSRQILDLMFS
jgi:hypothetical protein